MQAVNVEFAWMGSRRISRKKCVPETAVAHRSWSQRSVITSFASRSRGAADDFSSITLNVSRLRCQTPYPCPRFL